MTKNKAIKSRTGKILAALLIAAMVFPASPMVASVAAADLYGPEPTVTTGRILTPDQTGDKYDWVEIAKSGDCSLIVRTEYLHFNRNYNDPFWQYFPYGATNEYLTSNIRQKVNTWFTALLPYDTVKYLYTVGDDALPVDARLRNFTMQNNAINTLGTSGTRDALTNGLSRPTSFQVGTGSDIAFILSFSEAANYVSDGRAISGFVGNENKSPVEAISNFQKMNVPSVSGLYTSMWLRSPGSSAATVGSVITSGYTSQTLLYSANYVGYIFPALWVKSTIFGDDATPPVTPPTNPGTYAVDGRVLTPDLTGDTVNWIEIARNGNSSLIVRSTYLSVQRGYGDPAWQYWSFGLNGDYMSSTVRNRINIWFNGTVPAQNVSGWSAGDDGLAPDARLRNYTLQSDMVNKIGTCTTKEAMTNGISSPTIYRVGVGNDIAFALSYSESANFLSLKHFQRNTNPSQMPSSDFAISNFSKIHIPNYGANDSSMWLRSLGDCAGTSGQLDWRGVAFQGHWDPSLKELGYVYPAVWVDQGIFETKATVIVEHVNYYNLEEKLMENEVFTVDAGLYGPYQPKSFDNYYPGFWDSSSAPILGMIQAGQTITIRFFYMGNVD